MTALSVHFSKALARGRTERVRDTRASLLAALLRKRATAHTIGAEELEALLRDQIRWALPMQDGTVEHASVASAVSDEERLTP